MNSSFIRSDSDNVIIWAFFLFIILLIGTLITITALSTYIITGLIGAIIFYSVVSIIFYLIGRFANPNGYCTNCNKRIHAVFRDHQCRIVERSPEIDYDNIISQELKNIKSSKLSQFLKNDKEKRLFEQNVKSYYQFLFSRNLKYCMVSMGSILEFLLIRYCKYKGIAPEDYTAPNGNILKANKKRFANYLQSAINNDIFNMKQRWKLVQDYLRDFRNYVHIEKEVKSEKIDKEWFDTLQPAFLSIYKEFKQNGIK